MKSQGAPGRAGRPLAEARRRLGLAPEDLSWLGTIALAVALVAAASWIAPQLAKLYPDPADDVFAVWRELIAPEPVEQARALLVLAAPFLLAGCVAALATRRPARASLDPLLVGAQVVALGLVMMAVVEQERRSGFLPLDYFDPLLLSVPNLVAGLLIGVLLTAALLRWGEHPPQTLERIGGRFTGVKGVAPAIAVLVTAIWLLPAVATDGTMVAGGPIAAGHIPVQAEDYLAVVNERTPLVDYIAQYTNLLPLIVAPVLAAFDSSIASFTIVMCVLSGIGLLAVYGVFREVAQGPWAALALYVPFVALSLFPWNDEGAFREFNANYFGVLPGRFLGPFLLAWLCALSIRRRIPIWGLYGFAGLVLWNNAEFGIGAVLALTLALIMGRDPSDPLGGRLRTIALEGVAGLAAATAFVCIVVLLRTGELPDPSLLTYFNRLFLRDSYGLVPMPTLGLHWALYATYAAALVIASVRYVREEPDRTLTAMLAFAGAFGLVSGMYYVGRSSQFQVMLLFPAWGLALALVAWTAARSLRSAAGDRARLTRLLLPACAALIGFGVMVSTLDRLPPPWRQVERLSAGGAESPAEAEAERYVESNTSPGDRVLILRLALDHRVAERAGVINVSPLNGVTSLVSPAEANRALNQLEDEGGTAVFEAVSSMPENAGLSFEIPEFAELLRERGYALEEEDPVTGLRLWRR